MRGWKGGIILSNLWQWVHARYAQLWQQAERHNVRNVEMNRANIPGGGLTVDILDFYVPEYMLDFHISHLYLFLWIYVGLNINPTSCFVFNNILYLWKEESSKVIFLDFFCWNFRKGFKKVISSGAEGAEDCRDSPLVKYSPPWTICMVMGALMGF